MAMLIDEIQEMPAIEVSASHLNAIWDKTGPGSALRRLMIEYSISRGGMGRFFARKTLELALEIYRDVIVAQCDLGGRKLREAAKDRIKQKERYCDFERHETHSQPIR